MGGQSVAEHGRTFQGEGRHAGGHASKQCNIRCVHQPCTLCELIELFLVIPRFGIGVHQCRDIFRYSVNFSRSEECQCADLRVLSLFHRLRIELRELVRNIGRVFLRGFRVGNTVLDQGVGQGAYNQLGAIATKTGFR